MNTSTRNAKSVMYAIILFWKTKIFWDTISIFRFAIFFICSGKLTSGLICFIFSARDLKVFLSLFRAFTFKTKPRLFVQFLETCFWTTDPDFKSDMSQINHNANTGKHEQDADFACIKHTALQVHIHISLATSPIEPKLSRRIPSIDPRWKFNIFLWLLLQY